MFKKSLIALSLAVAATGSFAQVYVEGAFGSGNVNQTYSNATSSKTSSTGSKFVIGYEITKDYSIEGQLLSYGKATASNATASAEAKVTGTGVGLYWNTGNDKWGFKLGAALVSTKNAETQTNVASTNTGHSGLGLGVGGSYKFTDTVALTFGLDTAPFKANNVTGTGSARLMSVGLRARF